MAGGVYGFQYSPQNLTPLLSSASASANAKKKKMMMKSSYGRRELFVNTTSFSTNRNQSSPSSSSSSEMCPRPRAYPFSKEQFTRVFSESSFARRGVLLASMGLCLWWEPLCFLSAHALGDPSVTIEEVSPPVFSSLKLYPAEERIVDLFEKNTYSVVNIFDVTLRPQLNITGAVEVPEGNGSGVVWDEAGHIVTNYHVVGNALSRNPSTGQVVARVNILASEGVQKNFEGKLVGADRTKDLAVLKVEAPPDLLKPIKVGDSYMLKVGQKCLAIGNPFGFDHTLTVGVISGLNREIFSKTGVTIGGGIQTDAAINPGNSGGPLLDSKGNLIGINAAIFTQTGTSAGVGFAIPSATVLKIIPQLIQYGKVIRPSLDIEVASDLVANQLNIRNGALILQVPENGNAAKAGFRPTRRAFAGNLVLGDIVVGLDDHPVRSKAELLKVLDDYSIGDEVVVHVQRGNEMIDLRLKLEMSS